jgi:hypothetical protein
MSVSGATTTRLRESVADETDARARTTDSAGTTVRVVASSPRPAEHRAATTVQGGMSGSAVMTARPGTVTRGRTVRAGTTVRAVMKVPVVTTVRVGTIVAGVESVRGRAAVAAGSRAVGRGGRRAAPAGVRMDRPVIVPVAGNRPRRSRLPSTTTRCSPTM